MVREQRNVKHKETYGSRGGLCSGDRGLDRSGLSLNLLYGNGDSFSGRHYKFEISENYKGRAVRNANKRMRI
jgi:hypothetical protein